MRKTVYQVGDRVVPVDLPRRLECRVTATDDVPLRGGERAQILTLQPLDGPWEQGTTLVRLDSAVRPAGRHVGGPATRGASRPDSAVASC